MRRVNIRNRVLLPVTSLLMMTTMFFSVKKGLGKHEKRYTLVRKYFPHKDTEGFHRTIFELHHNNIRAHDVALIRYEWRGERRPLKITPHGNSKNSKAPFIRAKTELIQNLKTTSTASAQATINKHFEKEGGGENIYEFSSVPRNRKMIYNHAKVSESRTSDFRALMEMNLEDDFVQGFEIFKCPEKGPLPRCVLYTSQQIEDIKRYCCEGNIILSFDCTFDLGPAYVTVGCFRHPGFVNKSNK